MDHMFEPQCDVATPRPSASRKHARWPFLIAHLTIWMLLTAAVGVWWTRRGPAGPPQHSAVANRHAADATKSPTRSPARPALLTARNTDAGKSNFEQQPLPPSLPVERERPPAKQHDARISTQPDDDVKRSEPDSPPAAPEQKMHAAAIAAATDPGDRVLIDLYEKHRILLKAEYATIRRVFADRFEKKHADQIRAALGEPGSPLRKWLDARPELKEEFYIAIDPEHDDVPRALALFKELYARFPDKLEDYASLAIAVAVVWDREDGAIHGGPIGGSIMPEGQMGPVENFRYYVETERVMQDRIRSLPWEFLVYVVNHRTTLPERKWALLSYLPKRTMIGKSYHDVPYDHDSLKGEPYKIAGKLHTLPNQLLYGGQCGCQSDYAARIAKSLGVPAAVVDGHTQWSSHVWVEWVELGAVTPTRINFSLEAESRHAGVNDVGHVTDPHTGLPCSDRQMELRLHTVGWDPLAKRQADLLMRAYPVLREKLALDLPQQLRFLSRILKSCPGNEEAWTTVAHMSRDGQITMAHQKLMNEVLKIMFLTFRRLPDFTWVVFNDMVSYEKRPLERAALYARLAAMYEQANRVDLSCEARLQHAELLHTHGYTTAAMSSLAAAILIFPNDQTYVPRMLDKLDGLAQGNEKTQQQLVQFYQQFLPSIFRSLNDPGAYKKNRYCAAMYNRGADKFDRAGLKQIAQACRMQAKLLEETAPERRRLGRPVGAVLEENSANKTGP
jgi:hypothetical protein